jgi:hypothetical protein
MVLNGTMDGLPQPELISQSAVSMWSVECLPKIRFLVSNGGNYLGWVVLEMVKSLAWHRLEMYIESRRRWQVHIWRIDFGNSISDAS